MSPKPAYEELSRLIKGKWWTQVETETNAGGQVGLRGFFGNYQLSVRHQGRELQGQFVLDADLPGAVEVQVS